MLYNNAIAHIKKAFCSPLPGSDAHIEMLPSSRPINFNSLKNTSFRDSGVALILYPKNNTAFSVLIERAVYNGVHSGQISLPGGKKEESDTNLIETALREAEEETGIKKNSIELLGSLSELYIPPSSFRVLPVVCCLKEVPQFEIEVKEVAAIIEYDIDTLIKQSFDKTKKFKGADYAIEAPYFDINGYSVWGATAMILNEFRKLF